MANWCYKLICKKVKGQIENDEFLAKISKGLRSQVQRENKDLNSYGLNKYYERPLMKKSYDINQKLATHKIRMVSEKKIEFCLKIRIVWMKMMS